MEQEPTGGPKPERRATKSEATTAARIREHLADDDRPRPEEHGMPVWDLFQPLHNYFRW
jgi:hypothetical protein